MSRPAPVSAYNSLEAFRLHYSWQVPGYHAGTTDGCACISPFSGINYTRLCNNCLPEPELGVRCPRVIICNRLDAVRESNAIGVSRIAGIHAGLWHFKIVHIQKALRYRQNL